MKSLDVALEILSGFCKPVSNEQLGSSSVTGRIENGSNAVDVTSSDEDVCII